MSNLATALKSLLDPAEQAESRSRADAWLRQWQRSQAAWTESASLIAQPPDGAPLGVRLFAAQTLRSKVLLDLDQIPQHELDTLRTHLLGLCSQIAKEHNSQRVLLVQCAVAIADLALQTQWTGIVESLVTCWGSDMEKVIAFLEVLVALVEEQTHPLLAAVVENDEIFRRGAPGVASWLSGIDLRTNCGTATLIFAALRCTKTWLPWIPPPSKQWVEGVVQCLVSTTEEVGDEAVETLTEMIRAGDRWEDSHGHLPETVCALVMPLLGQVHTRTSVSDSAATRILRVASEAAEAMLKEIVPAVNHGDLLAVQLIQTLAATASSDPRSASYFFNGLAIEASRFSQEKCQAIEIAFQELLRTAVGALQCDDSEDPDDHLIDLCFVAVRGLGEVDAVHVLMQAELGHGRTWALGAALPLEPLLDTSRQDMEQWVWSELDRAVDRPCAAEAWLLRRGGKWLVKRPAALPRVIGALLHARRDIAAHAIVVDANGALDIGFLAPLLAEAAPGRPIICSAAVLAARALDEGGFKAVLDRLTATTALVPGSGAKDALRGMANLISGLRGLERSPTLGRATAEAINRVAAMAWTVILQPPHGASNSNAHLDSDTGEAALEVLTIALVVGRSALPNGDAISTIGVLVEGFLKFTGPLAAEAMTLLVRELGDEEDLFSPLANAVAKIAMDGLMTGWDSAGAKLIASGADHLAAAWCLIERAARHMPMAVQHLVTDETHKAACVTLASLHPVLILPSLGVLNVWLENCHRDEGVSVVENGLHEEMQERIWISLVTAIRATPPPVILESLPAFIESLRAGIGEPFFAKFSAGGENGDGPPLAVLVRRVFSGCASTQRLDAATQAIIRARCEREIADAVADLVHVARRQAACAI